MRHNPTDAEDRLWQALRGKRLAGWKFKRQQKLGGYIADFVCFEARLIVEADGSQHADSSYDARRDAWLKAQDFRILRLWNNDIFTNSDSVLTAILAALEGESAASSHASATPLPDPPPQGGREKKDALRG